MSPLERGRGVFMRKQWVIYNPRLKQIAHTLRKNMPLSEILLWKEIKGKLLCGYDFHTQKPIAEYIVDFYCPQLQLVIEMYGDSHEGKENADIVRQKKLELIGLTVLRFLDSDVKDNVDGIVEQLKEWIESKETHPLIPSRQFKSVLRGDFVNAAWYIKKKLLSILKKVVIP